MGDHLSSTSRRIGFFGGSFDPPHTGHLEIARLAIDHGNLDKLLVCPAHHAPLRDETPLFSSDQRMAMVRELCAHHPKMEVCPIEIDHGKVRFTFDTIMEIASLYPAGQLFLIIGSDQFSRLGEWKSIEMLVQMVHFLVFARGSSVLPSPPLSGLRMTPMNNPLFNLSSTRIREQLASGRIPEDQLPKEVIKILKKYDLPSLSHSLP